MGTCHMQLFVTFLMRVYKHYNLELINATCDYMTYFPKPLTSCYQVGR